MLLKLDVEMAIYCGWMAPCEAMPMSRSLAFLPEFFPRLGGEIVTLYHSYKKRRGNWVRWLRILANSWLSYLEMWWQLMLESLHNKTHSSNLLDCHYPMKWWFKYTLQLLGHCSDTSFSGYLEKNWSAGKVFCKQYNEKVKLIWCSCTKVSPILFVISLGWSQCQIRLPIQIYV